MDLDFPGESNSEEQEMMVVMICLGDKAAIQKEQGLQRRNQFRMGSFQKFVMPQEVANDWSWVQVIPSLPCQNVSSAFL